MIHYKYFLQGVLLSHINLVSTSTCILYLKKFTPADMYIAYLPLAHVLEMLSEMTMLLLGVPVGYSTPNTMTDMSSAIMKGDKGDVSLLRPTIMCSVPLILIRIQKVSSLMMNIDYHYHCRTFKKLSRREVPCFRRCFSSVTTTN